MQNVASTFDVKTIVYREIGLIQYRFGAIHVKELFFRKNVIR